MITLKDKVVVSDPCYKLGLSGQLCLRGVKPGKWSCSTEKIDGRVSELCLRHTKHCFALIDESVSRNIGVDSGQCGVFDFDYYAANVNDDDFDDLNSWYRRVCNKTIEESCWGEIDGLGCVSESGWGDGCYECLVGRNEAGEIVGIRLVYIEEMEEEDDE